MKKLLAFFAITFGLGMNSFAQTATNFISTDCSGNVHNLFTELDTGRVVVLTWVMPCGGCIGPAQTSYAIANSYGQQYPGRVVYYICDDYGNLACSSLTQWAITNGMHCLCFSDSNIRMSDYGADAMPKTIILGGYNHHVYYMNDLGADTAAMHAAINAALLATGISEANNASSNSLVYPNPASDIANVSFTVTEEGNVTIEILNLTGELIRKTVSDHHLVGTFRDQIDCTDLADGAYLVKVSCGDTHAQQLLAIKHR